MKSFDSTTGESTWITPPELQKTLGKFDLDPCAADDMPYRTATRMVTKSEDGLKVDWTGESMAQPSVRTVHRPVPRAHAQRNRPIAGEDRLQMVS